MTTKIIIFILCLAGIWYGFKLLGRHADARLWREDREPLRQRRQSPFTHRPQPEREKAPERAADPDAEDMIKCQSCGSYVSAQHATACGRADCPYT